MSSIDAFIVELIPTVAAIVIIVATLVGIFIHWKER